MTTLLKNKLLVFAIAFLFVILAIGGYSLNNVRVLFAVANGLDQPSKSYYLATERIYKTLSQSKCDEIVQFLSKGNNEHLHDLYIHSLGVTGCVDSSAYLLDLYVKVQHDRNKRSTCNNIVNSMGLSGNSDYVSFLEVLLKDYEKLSVQPSRYSIARALYLLTGKQYQFESAMQSREKFTVTKELAEANNIIASTHTKPRTFEEIVKLDKLFRSPDW